MPTCRKPAANLQKTCSKPATGRRREFHNWLCDNHFQLFDPSVPGTHFFFYAGKLQAVDSWVAHDLAAMVMRPTRRGSEEGRRRNLASASGSDEESALMPRPVPSPGKRSSSPLAAQEPGSVGERGASPLPAGPWWPGVAWNRSTLRHLAARMTPPVGA